MAWILWTLSRGIFIFSRVLQNSERQNAEILGRKVEVGCWYNSCKFLHPFGYCAVGSLEEIRGIIPGIRFQFGFRGRIG